jgi:hypothetical protein
MVIILFNKSVETKGEIRQRVSESNHSFTRDLSKGLLTAIDIGYDGQMVYLFFFQ